MADAPKTLRVGVDELLYANITATGLQATFALPPQSMNFRGNVVFSLAPIPIAGTITVAVTFAIQAVLSPQGANPSPTGVIAKQVLVSAASNTQSAYTGLSLGTSAAPTPVIVDLSGFGGNGGIALNILAFTLGTATGFAIYAHLG